MTKYEEMKQKANTYKHRLVHATAYSNNLERGFIVSRSNASVLSSSNTSTPFTPFLANRASPAYGYIDIDEFSEEEMDVLKSLVRSHVDRLEQKYIEAANKIQAIEDLLS